MSKFSALQESWLNSKSDNILIYGGYKRLLTDVEKSALISKFTILKQRPSGNIGEFYLGSWSDFNISERKLLQSSSKQSRIISVVCK